jgi:hypothetical protein
VSPLFIGPLARWIVWVSVMVPFFPPHSETSRRFQSGHRLQAFGAGGGRHWLEFLDGPRAPSAD